MLKFFQSIIIAVFILTFFVVSTAASSRIALVIGNGAYQSAPLKNPVNDAGDMANVLSESGFKVILKINASQKEMETAVRSFGKKLRMGGTGLFYYAGHGLQLNGTNYLIPVDALIETESDVKYEAVDAGRILGKMEDAGNNLNIVILDACRNNPFARSFRSAVTGLARMDAPTGSLVAYATAPGKLAADGGGRNGIYSKHLIRNIRTTGLTIEQVMKNVRIAVAKETLNKQIPWESSSLMGDFYFNLNAQKSAQSSTTATFSDTVKKDREKLEQEKRESEKIQSEMAEQLKLEQQLKQVEVEKQKLLKNNSLKLASVIPEDNGPDIIARDGQYLKYKNGIVYDEKNGIEWLAGPDKNTGGYAAKKWVKNLNLDDGGWRMPTKKELSGLYKSGAGTRNMTPLLDTSGWWVYSSSAAGFSFSDGDYFYTYNPIAIHLNHKDPRVFAVRSRR
jgi:hypothetical protein